MEVARLIRIAKTSLRLGVKKVRPGATIGDIGNTIQRFVEGQGYGVVRELCGHGIGKELHEDPQIPNFGKSGKGPRLKAGMTIAIEPMLNLGTEKVEIMEDGWTVLTRDRKPSAHFEHTVAIMPEKAEILTLPLF